MKQIRLITAVAFLLASAASATVFQPTTDRQLVDRSETIVVATVRDASPHPGANGYIVTDYRLDVERTIKGTAAGTITISEIGGVAGQRFTFIADSAVYTPGERVMVFLRKRGDGTYFTSAMAMGRFSYTRNATGETVVTRDVSELRDDPARDADKFERFVRDASHGLASEVASSYTTTLKPIAAGFHPIAQSFTAQTYTLSTGGFGARWAGGESGATVTFYVTGSLPNASAGTTASGIADGLAAWTSDPNAGIVLNGGTSAPPANAAAPNGDDNNSVIYLGYDGTVNVAICDQTLACTIDSGGVTHTYKSEQFVSISDADIVFRTSVTSSQFETFIAHEMGHAIGLRHSDQNGSGGSCAPPLDCSSSALMSASVNTGFGSTLQAWDQAANDTVYGNGPPCIPITSVSISGGGTIPSGQAATLTANVTGGNGTFTYAWFQGSLNDTSHPVGTNSPTFTTPPVTTSTDYWVKVTNGCSNVPAQTTVNPQVTTCVPPAVTSQPAPVSINSGGTTTLSVGANGSPVLSFQWYQATSNTDTSKPVGTNSPFFTTPVLTQNTSYWVKVSNGCSPGSAPSNVAVVTVIGGPTCNPPTFSIQPGSATVLPGSQTFLIAFATGATSYQWYKGIVGDTSAPVSGSGPSNDRWINQIHVDLLGHPADAASISAYDAVLGGGGSRTTVAISVLSSTEYRQRLLTDFYATFLHRPLSAGEALFWMPAFTAGMSDEQIESQIVASPEYFALAGSTNAGWINQIFNDVLGRAPSAAEVTTYSALLSSSSRMSVGLSILNSGEAANRRVQQYYARFLRRSPSAAEVSAFVAALLGSSTDEQVIAQIVAADEYFNFGTILITDAIATTTRYWVRASNGNCAGDSSVAVLTVPQCAQPTIVTQPSNKTVTAGTPVSVGVIATGATAYQWYQAASGNQVNPIAGATGPVLTITPAVTGSIPYWVKVSSSCAASNSVTVTITVNCGTRALSITATPTASSASNYTVSWNGNADLDARYELQEATKSDFSDTQTFAVSGAASRIFTHTVTADANYYYRVRAFPACGGTAPDFSPANTPAGVVLVSAPQTSTRGNYDFSTLPCTQNCTITQQIFIPAIITAGKTALATGDSFSVTSDKPFLTISPSSGPLPSQGTTVTATIDQSQLDAGSTQATVTINRTPAAGKTGALGDPPAPINVPVSVSIVAPVTPVAKDPNGGFNALLIPAVAHADGISSSFVSDIRLTNTSSQSITYQLTYTPNGTDGTVSGKQTSITVNAGDTKALNDIVKDWYGSGVAGESPQGSLEIRPANYAGKDPVSVSLASVAASRTYSVASTGTFGQFIPALQLVNFLSKSDVSKISLQQVSQSSTAGGFRTNLGFIEGSGQPVDFVATLLDDAGNKVAERAYSLRPYESQQMKLDQFFNVPGISDGRVEVRVTSDTGHISAYASVLDNTTTDPLLVFPADPSKISASRFVVPGVAEFDSSFSNFHTDMRIYNGGTSAVDVTLTFTGASLPSKVRTIGPGQTLAIDNVLPTLWNTTGGGSVIATTASSASLIVTARTFSRDKVTGGTFGQFIPGVTVADSAGNGDRALQIVQLEESPAFRTNLGLVEVTGNSANVELLAYTPNSKVAARTVVPLSAGQYLQQGQIFKSLGFSNVYNGRITARVISGTGRVAAYGSVIDNRTTDPTYVPSQ